MTLGPGKSQEPNISWRLPYEQTHFYVLAPVILNNYGSLRHQLERLGFGSKHALLCLTPAHTNMGVRLGAHIFELCQ